MGEINEEFIKLYNNPKFNDGFKQGIRCVAEFVGTWDKQINCQYRFEDIILMKFNMLNRKNPRKKNE